MDSLQYSRKRIHLGKQHFLIRHKKGMSRNEFLNRKEDTCARGLNFPRKGVRLEVWVKKA